MSVVQEQSAVGVEIGETASAQQGGINTGLREPTDSDDTQSDIESNDSDDIDSEEEKPDDANREPLVDPASLESETYESSTPDEIEMVWKDYAAEKIESDRQVRERLKFVVSSKKTEADSEARGIQSLYNSSATDCALYSMFALNDTFDYVFRDPKARYNDPVSVVRILKDYVVTPLRRIGFVGAKRTIALKLAMQRAAELDMVSVIDELSVSEFIKNFVKSIGVDAFLNVITVSPVTSKAEKQELNALVLEVQPTESDGSYLTCSSQQLLEKYTLKENGGRKLTNPRNLIIQLNRSAESPIASESVVVYPLEKIELVDCMIGVARKCTECEQKSISKPADWECKSCFMCDEKHMKLKYCTYCDACFKQRHSDSEDKRFKDHRAAPIHGPSFFPREGVKMVDKWKLTKCIKTKQTDKVQELEIGEQVVFSDQDPPEFPSYPFELYAIVCDNQSKEGHVAFVRSDVELELDDIREYSAMTQTRNEQLQVTGNTGAKDGDTKPKNTASVKANVSSSLGATNDGSSNSSSSATTFPLASSAGPETPGQKETTAEVWVFFDPQGIPREDPRGGYNIPQVHTLTDFSSLINSLKDVELNPLSENMHERYRYQILCESVALFYRPVMRSTLP